MMFNFERKALEKINTGIAIIDCTKRIVFWNKELKKLSGIPKEEALGKQIFEVCPKFREKRYLDMFENLFTTGQGRFCSSQLHKAFVYPADNQEADVFQNLKADYIIEDNSSYALLQITDVTEIIKEHNKLKEIINKLETGYKEIKKSEQAAQKEASYDILTGVLNRHGLDAELQNLFFEAASSRRKLAVLFMDIDKFKSINDNYGHLIGDVLLQQVAGRIKSNTRQNKGRNADVLARVGGDEFVIGLSGVDHIKDISFVAEKIVKSMRIPFSIDNKKITVSASIGIAIYPDDSGDINKLIGHADKAMYAIKKAGGNGCVFYDKSLFDGKTSELAGFISNT